ncbi:MAG: hypothetical protein KJ666_04245 [Bacteroidetes bacterium]|nr:hypothetical protein [Bacteroidota bacterium]
MPAHNSNEAQVHSHKNHYSSLPPRLPPVAEYGWQVVAEHGGQVAAEYGWQEKK